MAFTIKIMKSIETAKSDVEFIEVKKPGGKVSKLQEYRIKELQDHGVKVTIHRE